jgi:hypothetical protein
MPDPNESGAFGSSFEEALAAAFGSESQSFEPSEAEVETPEVVEVGVPETEPVSEVEETPEEAAVVLPLDEETETPVEEDEPADTSGMSKSAGLRFKELRTELKAEKQARIAIEQKAAQAEARLKELEGSGNISEELKAKIASYESELQLSRLEATEAYRTVVTEPLKEVALTADAIAAKYEINADEILDALALTDQTEQDEAFEILLAGVNERDKLKIYALAEKLPAIFEQRQLLHDNKEQALAELEARKAESEQEAAATRATARKEATDLVFRRVEAKLPFLKTIGGVDLAAIKAAVVETDLESLDVANKSYNAFSGRALPKVAAAYKAALDEIEQLTNDLDAYRNANPGVGARGNQPSATPSADPGVNFADAVERAFAGIR